VLDASLHSNGIADPRSMHHCHSNGIADPRSMHHCHSNGIADDTDEPDTTDSHSCA
jgi:hypothetical protein